MIDLSQIPSILLGVAVRVGASVLIFLIGRWLARLARRWATRGLEKTPMTPSLVELLGRLAQYAVLLLTITAILAVLGLPIAAILSVSVAVIVLIGIALRESLADLAATVIFLVVQPFRIGELVEANGVVGTVQEISLFSTFLQTGDRKLVCLPNSKIQQSNITNYTRAGVLGADATLTIRYDADLLRAKEMIAQVIAADPRVLAEPPAAVVVRNLGENGVELLARPFVVPADYWAVKSDLAERIKLRFDQEGIALALAQREVRVVQEGVTQPVQR
jgi:small conductance mechanosensitive channel